MNPMTGSLTDLALAVRTHALQVITAPVQGIDTTLPLDEVVVGPRDLADQPTRSDWLTFAAPAAGAGVGVLGTLLGM